MLMPFEAELVIMMLVHVLYAISFGWGWYQELETSEQNVPEFAFPMPTSDDCWSPWLTVRA